MSTLPDPPPPSAPEPLKARPRPDVDRAKLRAQINERYKLSLEYLGR